MIRFRTLPKFAVLAVTAVTLSACFDLDQKVAIGRDGSGSYEIAVAAEGMVGDGLKQDHDNMLAPNKAISRTETVNGKVVRSAHVDFANLSDLSFGSEAISLHVLNRSLFGLGPTAVRFRRVFLVDHAEKDRARDHHDDDMSREVLQAFFGGHTYTFSVTLPGSVDRIAAVTVDGMEIKPEVTGDFYHGHTITWRMPLSVALSAKEIAFEVDFSAYGTFADAQTRTALPGKSGA